jgi:hypothetical protein
VGTFPERVSIKDRNLENRRTETDPPCGTGWNGFMHDYTVESPDCTDSDNYLFSDCGSAAWAFALFIAWNVLSMYIFVNMFTGVVVENFSFVFQLYGRVQSINREQMRAFKKAWAAFDKDRTGYLRREQFIPFFAVRNPHARTWTYGC